MSAYSDEERSALKAQADGCYFMTIKSPTHVAVLAIPKPDKKLPKGGLFDCPELFHGATLHINGSKPEWAK